MKKFDKILICTDLDGTLLNSEHKISQENLDAIEYFKSEGGLFTFITGRMPFYAAEIYNTVKPNIPFGCINGGGIYDHRTQKFVWMTALFDTVLELVEYVDKNMEGVGIQLNTAEAVYFCKDNNATIKFREITKVPHLTCPYQDFKEPIAKIIFCHSDEEQIFELIRLINKHPISKNFDYVRSARDLYEIIPKGINKGTVLEKMAEVLGLDINKTIAVGDYDNDVAMLRSAKIGFAVSNACQSAKAAADYITVSNNEHAIAKIISDLDEGKIIL